ncbi:MAG: hypothetical protein NC324_03030 [Bacteroides sp.]|nr:hypothetical protein [Bacteroides sp.]
MKEIIKTKEVYFGDEPTGFVFFNRTVYAYYGTPPDGLEVLTDEQVAFYKEHPSASVSEVRKCEMYVPPVPDLNAAKDRARRTLIDKTSKYLHDKVDHDKLNEAFFVKTMGAETDTVSMQVAEDRINYYGRLTAAIKAYRLETYREINDCTDVPMVDSIVSKMDAGICQVSNLKKTL